VYRGVAIEMIIRDGGNTMPFNVTIDYFETQLGTPR
jgi:hypothetical protein